MVPPIYDAIRFYAFTEKLKPDKTGVGNCERKRVNRPSQ